MPYGDKTLKSINFELNPGKRFHIFHFIFNFNIKIMTEEHQMNLHCALQGVKGKISFTLQYEGIFLHKQTKHLRGHC